MHELKQLVGRLLGNGDGATAIEYSLIAGLISIAILGGLTTVGTEVAKNFDTIATQVESAGGN